MQSSPLRDKIRLNVDITARTNETLEQMAADAGATKSEVVRRAIALMSLAMDGRKAGLKIGLATKHQPLAREIVGLD